MEKDPKTELKRLKKVYLEAEHIHQEEKDCLLRIISTFGTVVAMHEEMQEDLETVRELLAQGDVLPRDLIETELGRLKSKIIALESEPASPPEGMEQVLELKERITSSYRVLRKIMDALLEDFYPLTPPMAEEARAIDIDGSSEAGQAEFDKASGALLVFIEKLKTKISEDFRSITNAFMDLLDHVKGLEESLSRDIGGEERLKELEFFEMNVNREMGSIVNSFNIHRTIDEIKSTVIEKITNIKRLVFQKKEEETRRTQLIRENMAKLKKRITQTEKGMAEMTRRAKEFQAAAERDGLTGLYNRKAFDEKLESSLKAFHEDGDPFSIILFDVDGFKGVNDTLGHVAGDKVLQKVAECLVQSFRKTDFVARFGGDEFVVLIENLTREMAGERILKFNRNLRRIRFTSYAKGDIHITVSSGIALVMEGDGTEDLLERADRAMFDSKPGRGGKNNDTLSAWKRGK